MIRVDQIPPHLEAEVDRLASNQVKLADAESIEELMQKFGVTDPLSSLELDSAEFKTDYLIEGVLPSLQPSIVAGPSKGMKTTTAIDAALSIGSARRFLGKFSVPEPKCVLFLSAESGEATIQETARRISLAKGISLASEPNVRWGSWVPRAKCDEMMRILEHQLNKYEPAVCFIDPLYMVLDGEDQASVSLNGQQIRKLAKVCLDRNCTPVMVDHVKRGSINARNYQSLELEDVTGAGKAESVRSWMLIGRREKFDPEQPLHRLWLTLGGSAGHHGGYAVDVDESRDEAGNRTWGVTVRKASEAIREKQERRVAEKEARKQETQEHHVQKLKRAFVDAGKAGLTKTNAAELAGLNSNNANVAMKIMLDSGELVTAKVKRNNREFDGYRYEPDAAIGRT